MERRRVIFKRKIALRGENQCLKEVVGGVWRKRGVVGGVEGGKEMTKSWKEN